MLVCKAWLPCVEHIIYTCPRITSDQSMLRFIHVVSTRRSGASVKGLHIVGKINYSSMQPTPWVLQVPARLGPVVPNVRTLHFENLEGVAFSALFWRNIASYFHQVTKLRIEASRLLKRSDAGKFIIAFPNLTSLAIEHVQWPQWDGVRVTARSGSSVNSPPVRPLRRVEFGAMDSREVADALWLVSGGRSTVRDIAFTRNPLQSLLTVAQYLPQFTELRSLTLAPPIVWSSDRSKPFFCTMHSEVTGPC